MTKASEAAKKIREFRKALDMKRQEDLADAVGVRVTAVSAWERADEPQGYEPSAENYVLLGNLAAKHGFISYCRWFWGKAGIDEKAMLLAADEIVKGDPAARPIRLDDKSTILLDESDNGAPDLRPFWNQMVLVDLGRRADRKQGEWGYFYPEGPRLGRLFLRESPSVPPGLEWRAVLAPVGASSEGELSVGFWQYENSRLKLGSFDGPGDWVKAREEARSQAPEQMQLSHGWKILGRVASWSRPSGEKK